MQRITLIVPLILLLAGPASARNLEIFFIDVEGHQKDAPLSRAIAALREKAPFLKILGSYPAA